MLLSRIVSSSSKVNFNKPQAKVVLLWAASPELNPIERFWQYIKEELSWKIYEKLEELKEEVRKILTKITPKTITSLTNWNYLQKALTVV